VIDSDNPLISTDNKKNSQFKSQSLPRGVTLSKEAHESKRHISKIYLPIIVRSNESETYEQSSHVVFDPYDTNKKEKIDEDFGELTKRSMSLSLTDLLTFSETTV